MSDKQHDDNAGAADAPPDENKLIAERREKLRALRAQGIAFPNDFKPDAFAGDLQREFADGERWTAEAIDGVDPPRPRRGPHHGQARHGQGELRRRSRT